MYRIVALFSLLVLLSIGAPLGFVAALAIAQTGEPTVETRTFTHEDVVTYTVPTVTETVVVTETVQPPPPPPPEPPPPPPPPAGTVLTFRDTFWRCTAPLSSYGALPLTVVMTYSENYVPPTGGGAVQLGSGCVGDLTPATDLIVDIQGDGLTHGPGEDAFRIMNGSTAHDIEIEGHADCGGRVGDAHQDGIQILGGRDITFRNFTVGDYDAGLSTCQGAGGTVFYSLASENIDVVGGKFIACNHSLLAGTSSPGAEVRDASFRTGRNDGSDPVCNYASSNPCIVQSGWGGTVSGLTCEQWIDGAWRPVP